MVGHGHAAAWVTVARGIVRKYMSVWSRGEAEVRGDLLLEFRIVL